MTRDPVLLKLHELAERLRQRAAEKGEPCFSPLAHVLEQMRASRRVEPPPPHWSEADRPEDEP